MRLSELRTGEKGVIVKVLGHGGFRKRIVEMGFIKGNYIDVYGTLIILFLTLIGGFSYAAFKVVKFLYTHYKIRNDNSKSKKE